MAHILTVTNHTDIGLGDNASPEHQSLETIFYRNFIKLYPFLQNHIQLCCSLIKMEETEEGKKKKEKIPDIVIFREVSISNGTYIGRKPLVIIELDNKNSQYNTKEKAPFIFKNFPTVKEFFIFLYDVKKFIKYTHRGCDKTDNASYSNELDLDLTKLYKCDPLYTSTLNEVKSHILHRLELIVSQHQNEIEDDFNWEENQCFLYDHPHITLFRNSLSGQKSILTIDIVDDDTQNLTRKFIKANHNLNSETTESFMFNINTMDWEGIRNGRKIPNTISKVLNIDVMILTRFTQK